jgi:hypothetical protein
MWKKQKGAIDVKNMKEKKIMSDDKHIYITPYILIVLCNLKAFCDPNENKKRKTNIPRGVFVFV